MSDRSSPFGKYCVSNPAKALAIEALKPKNDGIALYDLPDDFSPGFFAFEIVSMNAATSLVVGHIAIDQESGDAWDLAGACRQLSSSDLSALQNRIREKYKVRKTRSENGHVRRTNCDAPSDYWC